MPRPWLALPAGLMLATLAPGARAGGPDPVLIEEAKLVASPALRFQLFGTAVAVSGDTAVVGAPDDSSTSTGGAAYVFVREGGGWVQQQKLTASDAALADYFGGSIALSGDTAVVGAYVADTPRGVDAGAAYVFVRTGTTWTQVQKLTASDGAAADYFASAVSVSGDTIVLGAAAADTAAGAEAGAAYVFVRSGTAWTEQQKLTPSDGAAGDYFGHAVAVSGDSAVVGAPTADTAAGTSAGAAWVFVRSGTAWTEEQKLTASDGAAFDCFGESVAIAGDTAAVAADRDDHRGGVEAGSVYVLTRAGTVWTEAQKLTASDPGSGDQFGVFVSISGPRLAVGAYVADTLGGGRNAGAAYVFVLAGDAWVEEQKLTASDGFEEDGFGISVSISGENVVVGAFGDDNAGGDEAGSAYLFRRTGAGFYAMKPCRAADTRLDGPALAANTTRTFAVAGRCDVPADARAVAAVLVAVNPGDTGDLRLYPAGAGVPPASALNFAPGRTRANNAVLALGMEGQLSVQCDMPPGSSAATHFVLDVFGYFK